jgi:hypothetical protein
VKAYRKGNTTLQVELARNTDDNMFQTYHSKEGRKLRAELLLRHLRLRRITTIKERFEFLGTIEMAILQETGQLEELGSLLGDTISRVDRDFARLVERSAPT